MTIKVAKSAGFCYGVGRIVSAAEKLAIETANLHKKVYTLGPVIHNKRVVSDLMEKGVFPVESVSELNSDDIVIIRSHGIPPEIYRELSENNIAFHDYTCPDVKRVQDIACGKFCTR